MKKTDIEHDEKRSEGLLLAIKKAGSISALGRIVGTTRQNVSKWRRVPSDHCRIISKKTRVPLKKLRPDIYQG